MRILKIIIVVFNIPRLIPAIVFFLFFKKKCIADVSLNIVNYDNRLPILLSFCYLMVFDKWYRNLFYYRIGKYKYIFSFLCPPFPSFFIGTYSCIGEGVSLVHPYSTYINAKAIGNYLTIRNNVTIGVSRGGKPSIGNRVTINANVVIVGNINIGDNVIIGAGTVLTKSIPSNCVVVGNPAYILKENGVRVDKQL